MAAYRGLARAEIDRLRAAGTVPLLVGGSGLYVRAVLDELDFPGTDASLAAKPVKALRDVLPGNETLPGYVTARCPWEIGRTYFEGGRRRSLATSEGYRTP